MSGEDIEKDPTEICEAAVIELFLYRDNYFQKHPLSEANLRSDRLQQEIQKTIHLLDKHEIAIPNRGKALELRGRTLNVLSSFNKQAHESLAKAVKLDLTLVDAWNELGESYWKCGNMKEAKTSLESALTQKRNKISLRNLSMVLRQTTGSQTERNEAITKSEILAKEAVSLDPKDGTSWFVLGNAYLSMFFTVSHDPSFLKQSLRAYAQAEKDPIQANNPDLHFNRYTLYKYQDEFLLALQDLTYTCQLDPDWTEAKQCKSSLLKYLSNVQDFVMNKAILEIFN